VKSVRSSCSRIVHARFISSQVKPLAVHPLEATRSDPFPEGGSGASASSHPDREQSLVQEEGTMSVLQSLRQGGKSALRPVPMLGSLLLALAASPPARAIPA